MLFVYSRGVHAVSAANGRHHRARVESSCFISVLIPTCFAQAAGFHFFSFFWKIFVGQEFFRGRKNRECLQLFEIHNMKKWLYNKTRKIKCMLYDYIKNGGGKWENKKPGWLHFDTSPYNSMFFNLDDVVDSDDEHGIPRSPFLATWLVPIICPAIAQAPMTTNRSLKEILKLYGNDYCFTKSIVQKARTLARKRMEDMLLHWRMSWNCGAILLRCSSWIELMLSTVYC